jgi:hypothetical protein
MIGQEMSPGLIKAGSHREASRMVGDRSDSLFLA